MRIKDMITQGKFPWYFNNFSTVPLVTIVYGKNSPRDVKLTSRWCANSHEISRDWLASLPENNRTNNRTIPPILTSIAVLAYDGCYNTITIRPGGGGGGGTRVYFGWVCAARVSKFGPRFRKNLHSKWYPVLEIGQFLIPRSRIA